MLSLDVLQLHAASSQSDRRRGNGKPQPPPRSHDHGPFDDVPELANVAGPRILLQRGHVTRADRVDWLAKRRRELLDESPHQQRYVVRSFAQRRHADREHAEAIVQVLAEGTRGDQLFEVAMGRGDDSRIDANWPRAPQSLDLSLFEYPRSSLTWTSSGRSPISSRKIVE